MSGGGAAEAPGRAEGARARSRSESSDQRVSGAPSRWRQGAASDAPERLAGGQGRGGEDAVCVPNGSDSVGSVSRTGIANHVRLCLSGQTQCGGEEEEEEETHYLHHVALI